jgi:hypothetical protein
MTWLNMELAKLEDAVESLNPSAIKTAVRDIRPFTRSHGVGNDIEMIRQQILIGDYERAVSAIKTIFG